MPRDATVGGAQETRYGVRKESASAGYSVGREVAGRWFVWDYHRTYESAQDEAARLNREGDR